MTTQDLKYEINKAIDEVPDYVLVEILKYLRQIQINPSEKVNLSRHLRHILQEDIELLQRLAL
jgi:hypothetical protein